jgi:hypothetical protein
MTGPPQAPGNLCRRRLSGGVLPLARIRSLLDAADYVARFDYIHSNPVKRGLVGEVVWWPYSWSHHREGACSLTRAAAGASAPAFAAIWANQDDDAYNGL